MKRVLNRVLSHFGFLIVTIYLEEKKVGYGIRRLGEGE